VGRRLVVGLLVLALFAAAGAAFVLLSGDDDASDTAQGTTTTIATGRTAAPSSSPTTAPATTAPPTASSSPVPDACGAEGAAISTAVNAGVAGARERAQVVECRFAAVDTSWASVRLVARPGADFTTTTVVVHGGGGSWAIVGTGSGACSQTPPQVRADLGLLCASGGGI
jgi:hypothetical protein